MIVEREFQVPIVSGRRNVYVPALRHQPPAEEPARFTLARRAAKVLLRQPGEPALTEQKRVRKSASQLIALTGDCLTWSAGVTQLCEMPLWVINSKV